MQVSGQVESLSCVPVQGTLLSTWKYILKKVDNYRVICQLANIQGNITDYWEGGGGIG